MPATKARKSHTTTEGAAQRRNVKAATAIGHSLEKTQAAVGSLRSDLGRDGKRIARDIEKLLRTARSDVARLSHAIRSDIERASKDGAHARPGAKSGRSTRAKR